MAILLWQARKSSVSLWRGITAAVRIPPVSFQEVRKAIRDSLPGLISRMKGDERNVLLTLFRMCFTLETGAISTKDAAAEWILSRLPADLAPLARMAGAAYLGKCVDDWSTVEKETLLLADLLRRRMEGDPGMLDSV